MISVYDFCFALMWLLSAASVSGSPMKGIEEFDDSSSEDNGIIATHLSGIKRWLLSHSQHLNFFTILLLASVSLTTSYLIILTIHEHTSTFH